MLEVVEDKRVWSHEKLDVWQKAFRVSLLIHEVSLTFPKMEQYALGDQMRRSSKSICANIAEGFAKQRMSKAEFKRFVMIALGSANEMLVWLRYAVELGYIEGEDFSNWYDEYESICKMLNVLHGRS